MADEYSVLVQLMNQVRDHCVATGSACTVDHVPKGSPKVTVLGPPLSVELTAALVEQGFSVTAKADGPKA